MSFKLVEDFEKKIAEFFGAPFAVATDSCTHGIELSLRYTNAKKIFCPKHTYISIPFLSSKLGIKLEWINNNWNNYYYLTENVIDAAVLWKPKSYIPRTFMSISFQYQKHLSLGRGGIILCDNLHDAEQLKKMSYDGRLPNIPWKEQDIDMIGYHYYMTPETANLGLIKLPMAIINQPKTWTIKDWPDLTQMDIFK
jgi:dTDP-4-amino-4,6-dideoxygalactose transaminase